MSFMGFELCFGWSRELKLRWRLTGTKIAEQMQLPPALERAWHCRGYYSSLNHNGKGIYPKKNLPDSTDSRAFLAITTTGRRQRYVGCFGDVKVLCDKADTLIDRKDYGFATTLFVHAVPANPESPNTRACILLVTLYKQLGFGAKNATWSNFYLTAAQELRIGKKAGMAAGDRTPLGEKLSDKQCFEILSVQLDSRKALKTSFCIDFDVVDISEQWLLFLNNRVLTHRCLESEPCQKEAREKIADLKMELTNYQVLEFM